MSLQRIKAKATPNTGYLWTKFDTAALRRRLATAQADKETAQRYGFRVHLSVANQIIVEIMNELRRRKQWPS